MSRNVRKHTFEHVRAANIQISLRIAQCDQNVHCVHLDSKDAKCLYADNEDCSDCAIALADFSLCWVHISHGVISHVTTDIILRCSIDRDFSFDDGISEEYGCEVHSFDPR